MLSLAVFPLVVVPCPAWGAIGWDADRYAVGVGDHSAGFDLFGILDFVDSGFMPTLPVVPVFGICCGKTLGFEKGVGAAIEGHFILSADDGVFSVSGCHSDYLLISVCLYLTFIFYTQCV